MLRITIFSCALLTALSHNAFSMDKKENDPKAAVPVKPNDDNVNPQFIGKYTLYPNQPRIKEVDQLTSTKKRQKTAQQSWHATE